ncbi:tape measure protein [Sulfurimonas sp.]
MEKELKIKISVDKKTGAIKVIDKDFKELSTSVKTADRSVDGFNKNLENAAKAGASLYIIKQAFDIAGGISETGMEIESMTLSLESAVGSSQKAREELEFLKETTDELGLVFKTSVDGFTQFSAAARQTKLEGKGVEDIFGGVSTAAAAMTLSVDNQNGVFRALTQMLSKGKVQAEELRGQLGERLPGAFQIAARAMNMTTAELDKFMADGKLISEDFLPKFAQQLETEFKDKAVNAAQTARAEQARYNNELLDMKLEMNDSGIDEFTKDFYKLGTVVLKEATHWLHEWNIQAKEMRDVKSSSGVDKLKEQYTLAVDELKKLELQEKSVQEQIRSREGIWNIVKGVLKSETGLNAEIINQKGLIEKLEKTLNASIENSITSITDYNANTENTIELTKEQIKAQEKQIDLNTKLNDTYIAVTGTEYDIWANETSNKMVEMAKSTSITTEALEKYHEALMKTSPDNVAKEDLEILNAQNKANLITQAMDLTKSETESVNDRYLEMFDVVDGIFDDSQMKKFYKSWEKELTSINKKQKGYDGIGSSDWASNLNGQYAALANIGNAFSDMGKEQKKWNEFSAENKVTEEDKNKHLQAQLSTYGNLAGAVGSMYEEGSNGAKAALVAQQALAIVEGGLAVVHAMTAGDPYTAIPRAIAVAAMVAQAIGGSSSVGGESSYTAPDFDQNRTNIEDSYIPITDRLDRQIELLQELNYAGTAGIAGVNLGSETFTRDVKLAAQDVAEAMFDTTFAWGYTLESLTESQQRQAQASAVEASIRQSTGQSVDLLGSTRLADIGGAIGYATPVITEDFITKASKNFEVTLSFLEAVNSLGAFELVGGEDSFDAVLNSVQNSLNDWVMSILDISNELKETSSDLKDYYDDITGISFYADKQLSDAFSDLDRLSGSKSYATYIQEQVTILDQAQALFDEDLISLLLSTNVNDLSRQTDAIRQISASTGEVFANGAEDVLNYIESIELVAEAMTSSRENIKSWEDSFKTELELAQDLAGGKLKKSFTDLNSLYLDLSVSGGLLTDTELERLEANKSILDTRLDESLSQVSDGISSFDSTLSSLGSTIDKLRGSASGSTYALDNYYSSMTETMALSDDVLSDAFKESLENTIGYSSALFEDIYFAKTSDQEFAQLMAAKQFEEMETSTLTQLDYLKTIQTAMEEGNIIIEDLRGLLATLTSTSEEQLDVNEAMLELALEESVDD